MFGFVSGATLNDVARLLIDDMDQAIAQHGKMPRSKSSKGAGVFDLVAEIALKRLFQSTGAICREYRLGMIGRARLAKALQAELRGRGYGVDVVAKVTSAVVTNALVVVPNNHQT